MLTTEAHRASPTGPPGEAFAEVDGALRPAE
jgi:hypothetical protein